MCLLSDGRGSVYFGLIRLFCCLPFPSDVPPLRGLELAGPGVYSNPTAVPSSCQWPGCGPGGGTLPSGHAGRYSSCHWD